MGKRVVVVGGGLAGCGAAVAAAKMGAEVVLLERMEVLGGCGNVAGLLDQRLEIVREEMDALGSAEIFDVLLAHVIHRDVRFAFPAKVTDDDRAAATWILCDVTKLDGALRDCLRKLGVEVRLQARVTDVLMQDGKVRGVVLDGGATVEADAFVDVTGGAGGMGECQRYGNGCVMCFMRCVSFGNRVSVAAKAGAQELRGKKRDGSIGAISSGYCLYKSSLAPELLAQIEREGCAVVPVPAGQANTSRVESIATSGKTDSVWLSHAVIVDVGPFVKRSAAGYTPLEELRQIAGLENARYADPLAGSLGNGVRFMAISPRDEALRVPGIENLFVAGEKVGVNGVGEAAATGAIAGHNAGRYVTGLKGLALPRSILIGDFVAYINEKWDTQGLSERYHFFMGSYGQRIKARADFLNADARHIRQRVAAAGLTDTLANLPC